MSAREALVDALTAEMAADVLKLQAQLQELKDSMPGFLAGVKSDCDEAARKITASFDDFQASSLALAEFIKKRKAEVVADLAKSSADNEAATKRSLEKFTKHFWLIGAVCSASLLMNVAVVAVLLFKS